MREAADALASSQEALRAANDERIAALNRASELKPCEICGWPSPMENEHFICACCGFQPGYDDPLRYAWDGQWWSKAHQPKVIESLHEALRAAECARDEKDKKIEHLETLLRLATYRGPKLQAALQAKEQEIARLRAALIIPATYWREYFQAGDGPHYSTHDEFWSQWLNNYSEQINAALASSGAETP